MKLDSYRLRTNAPVIRPATLQRDWMDKVDGRHAYRCLPLNMANVSGWEILCPQSFDVTWNGGVRREDIEITALHPVPQRPIAHEAASHFRHGILTFHTGQLFRTDPGWAMWAGGPPNSFKDGIQPMSGIVETDWLPYPFTMNWRFTRPCTVRFEKDEPFCWITLMRPRDLESVTPRLLHLDDDPALKAEYEAWRETRSAFNQSIEEGDPAALRAQWQKFYMRGKTPEGKEAQEHTNRRRLAEPEEG
jgi:hypothetical protein